MAQLVVFFIVASALAALTGCIPGLPQPDIDVGNTTATTAPPAQTNSENAAPVFNITVSVDPKVVNAGGNSSLEDSTVDTAPGQKADTTSVSDEPAPVVLQSALAPEPEVDPQWEPRPEGVPRTKADEIMLLGPTWGGMSVFDYNVAECRRHPEYPGCEAYLEPSTALD